MKNILSLIIAFIVSVTTYPFSFLPSKNDTDFFVSVSLVKNLTFFREPYAKLLQNRTETVKITDGNVFTRRI